MGHSFWSILILYGSIQAIILSVVGYVRDRTLYLSLFFASISYLLFIYLFENFEWFREYPHFIWTNVPFWFLIGPLLYLHVHSNFKPARKELTYTLKSALHFLPALGVMIYFSDFYFGLSGTDKIAAFTNFYSPEQIIDYIQVLYLVQITAYLYAAYQILNQQSYLLNEKFSNSDVAHLTMIRKLSWGVASYIGLAIVFSIFLSFSAPDILPKFGFVFMALASTIFIATGYYLYYSFPPFHKALEIIQAPASATIDLPTSTEKYASSSLDQKDLSSILATVERYMSEHQVYKRPNLKIGELADGVDIPSHHISQCLNQKLGVNFFEFVNSYRIEAVKTQLQEGRHHQLTLWAIAKECGFNSQSSFYRIFKDYTGLTPSSYIKKLTLS